MAFLFIYKLDNKSLPPV